jgi:hypothetical protein
VLAWYRWVLRYAFQPGAPMQPDLRNSVVTFYSSIFTYQAHLANYLGKNTLLRFGIGLLKPGRWEDLIKEVEEEDQICRRYLENMAGPSRSFIAEQMALISKDLVQITRLIQERNGVLRWISEIDPFYTHNEVLRKLGKRYHSSATWLFESDEYQDWIASDFGFLILQGSVGTGKSSLISLAIEELNMTDTNRLAFYYCTGASRELENGDHTEPSRYAKQGTAVQILHCILRQISESKDSRSIDEEVVAEYQKSKGDHLYRLDMGLIKKVINNSSGVTVVIDGLDQCKEADTLLQYLRDLRVTEKLRVLISLRAANINPEKKIPEAKTIDVEKSSLPAIKQYIEYEIFESDRGLKGQDFEIEESQAKKLYDLLESRASGM